VLSTLPKIDDPLGWLSPVTIIGKLFMQKQWLTEQKWNQNLSDSDAKSLESIRIPRWVKPQYKMPVRIHGFSDASDKAYAAVVYANIIDDNS